MSLDRLTLPECAALAEQVYDDLQPIDSPSVAGWEAFNPSCWASGFSATIYAKAGLRVLAYRGTDDADDVLDNWEMAPSSSPEAVEQAMHALLGGYGVRRQLDWLPGVMRKLWSTRAWQHLVERTANRLPREQRRQALAYYDDNTRLTGPPDCIVGHSLGGGLAQIVSLERRVPAVAFNSPHIGGLQGGVPMTSINILHVNADLDPVSQVTSRAGSLPHGREMSVALPPPRARPPEPPQPRDLRIAARSIVGVASPFTHVPVLTPLAAGGNAIGMLGGSAMDAAARLAFYARVVVYLKDVAIYYHSIKNLRRAVDQEPTLRRAVSQFLPLR